MMSPLPTPARATSPRHPDAAEAEGEPIALRLRRLLGSAHAGSLGSHGLGLSEDDAAGYRLVFALQRNGDWAAADAALHEISDRRLIGHVEKQRFLHTDSKPGGGKQDGGRVSFDELKAWLQRYGDHADADRVHALALRRQPPGATPPPTPEDAERLSGTLDGSARTRVTVTPRGRIGADRAAVAQTVDRIDEALRAGKPAKALALLDTDRFARLIDLAEYDALRTRVAAGFFFENKPAAAYTLASAAAARSGEGLPSAHWYAGLASWRLGQYERAARQFESVAQHRRATGWEAAAGAFWSARAHRRLGHEDAARGWLEAAARQPRSFYGLIATRALGREPRFRWEVPSLSHRHLVALGRTPAGHRAIALLQAGQNDLAEAELNRIHPQDDTQLQEALVAVADAAGLARLAIRLGNALTTPEGGTWDAALYPLPHWTPDTGFAVDRALLFAFMRQESRFVARAISRTGARGLMQIMPTTANTVAETDDGVDFTGTDRARLNDPETSLTLGQRYIAYLMNLPDVSGGLFQLATAYNAGPGANARWNRAMAVGTDPLLHVESIPFRETREFVQKVSTNFWIYRLRLGQDTATLDAVAAGRWPVYSSADAPGLLVADEPVGDDDLAGDDPVANDD